MINLLKNVTRLTVILSFSQALAQGPTPDLKLPEEKKVGTYESIHKVSPWRTADEFKMGFLKYVAEVCKEYFSDLNKISPVCFQKMQKKILEDTDTNVGVSKKMNAVAAAKKLNDPNVKEDMKNVSVCMQSFSKLKLPDNSPGYFESVGDSITIKTKVNGKTTLTRNYSIATDGQVIPTVTRDGKVIGANFFLELMFQDFSGLLSHYRNSMEGKDFDCKLYDQSLRESMANGLKACRDVKHKSMSGDKTIQQSIVAIEESIKKCSTDGPSSASPASSKGTEGAKK